MRDACILVTHQLFNGHAFICIQSVTSVHLSQTGQVSRSRHHGEGPMLSKGQKRRRNDISLLIRGATNTTKRAFIGHVYQHHLVKVRKSLNRVVLFY